MTKRITGILLCSLMVACGGKTEEETPKLTEWAGATPHFKAVGKLNGETIDIALSESDAADAAKFYCEREYEVPMVNMERDYANGKLGEVKLVGPAIIDGQERYMEIELKKHHTQGDAVGASVTVVPRVDGEVPAANQMWFEWEWHLASDESTLFEAAAQSGTFKLGEFTGTPDSSGLVIPENTGTVGGFINARWSETDEVSISFTAKCTTSDVVELQ